MRVFVAIELPEDILDGLLPWQDGLPGRLVDEENLHLTLAFLGEVDEARLAEVDEALAGLRLAAPVLRVTGLDVFEGRKPKLAFATVERRAALETVQRAVAQAVRGAGVDLRRERFRPHVTLTRFGREMSRRDEVQLAGQLGPIPPLEARAEAFGLYRSELRPDGPRYVALARYEFY
ncbi:RNA 2',3'-cyclic phosphodiesterase [Marimonas lutisalis]|uniref:RNA 2',3'-cyclic phosphodiesterase n=1 Tax=Marimonas lutisalis TaxID=2545756 RepID=UPI0013755F6A|nr:RNA 2',3'-cyclic phosphodiesterase [Marimonas lutisalis]